MPPSTFNYKNLLVSDQNDEISPNYDFLTTNCKINSGVAQWSFNTAFNLTETSLDPPNSSNVTLNSNNNNPFLRFQNLKLKLFLSQNYQLIIKQNSTKLKWNKELISDQKANGFFSGNVFLSRSNLGLNLAFASPDQNKVIEITRNFPNFNLTNQNNDNNNNSSFISSLCLKYGNNKNNSIGLRLPWSSPSCPDLSKLELRSNLNCADYKDYKNSSFQMLSKFNFDNQILHNQLLHTSNTPNGIRSLITWDKSIVGLETSTNLSNFSNNSKIISLTHQNLRLFDYDDMKILDKMKVSINLDNLEYINQGYKKVVDGLTICYRLRSSFDEKFGDMKFGVGFQVEI